MTIAEPETTTLDAASIAFFTRERADTLFGQAGGVRISLFLPVDPADPARSEDAVLDRLIETARNRLAEDGMSPDSATEWTRGIRRRLDQRGSLPHRAESLAIFAETGAVECYALPYATGEAVTVGHRYAVKPLLPMISENPTYCVACVAREGTRIYHADRAGIEEVTIPDLPTTLEDVVWPDDAEKSLQSHTASTVSAAGETGAAGAARHHGQGLPKDLSEEQERRFFTELGKVLESYVRKQGWPLVVVSDPKNLGRLREESPLGGITFHGQAINPDSRGVGELHQSVVREGRTNCSVDLLDFIAAETIQHGGQAYTAPADSLTGDQGVVAQLRY